MSFATSLSAVCRHLAKTTTVGRLACIENLKAAPAAHTLVQARSLTTPLQSYTNPAAVLYGIDDLRYEDFPISSAPKEGEVRLNVRAVGICGSDVHFLKKGRIADYVLTSPMVIGHETAGEVAAVGPGVSGLRVGDLVAVEGGTPCWHSRASRKGRYNLCPEISFFATPPHHGSLRKSLDHPANLCYKLPEGMTAEEGALCEPLSVGIHACRRAGVQPGKKVVVLGAGPVGLVTLKCAKAYGADVVAVTDVKADNLALAKQFGASLTLQINPADSPTEIAQQLVAALQPYGPDIVIDCAGFESTVQTAIRAAVPGGRVVLVGMGQEQVSIPLAVTTVKELDVCGSFRYANTYDLAVNLVASKRVDVLPLITHRFGFSAEEVAAGFDTAIRADETKAIKVMFNLQ